MLRFAEEILLLLLDEERGEIASNFPPHSLNIVLAGAVLMDLALANRIDTDLKQLTLVDSTPLEDDLLDPILADLTRTTETHTPTYWVTQTAGQGDTIRDRALARLVERGILESNSESDGIFTLSRPVSRSRRYTVEGQTVDEVRLRIMRVLFSEEIPSPRDVVLVSLADACGVFGHILSAEEVDEARGRITMFSHITLSAEEVDEVRGRITLIRQMDLIGHSVREALRERKSAVLPPPPQRDPPSAGPAVHWQRHRLGEKLPRFPLEAIPHLRAGLSHSGAQSPFHCAHGAGGE